MDKKREKYIKQPIYLVFFFSHKIIMEFVYLILCNSIFCFVSQTPWSNLLCDALLFVIIDGWKPRIRLVQRSSFKCETCNLFHNLLHLCVDAKLIFFEVLLKL